MNPTGYEVQMYNNLYSIDQSLKRIATSLEALVEAQQKPTTPEDIEEVGNAIQAVKRGFASLEKTVRAQRGGST